MQVEIPDPNVLLGLATAFVIGLLVIIILNKVRPYVNLSPKGDGGWRASRIDEYERQLVEMKIRLDAAGIGSVTGDVTSISQDVVGVAESGSETAVVDQNKAKTTPKSPQQPTSVAQETNHVTYHNATEQVLHMVTTSAKTSRDIQAALGKSREHTARLLKKLYDAGLVERNAKSRPYTYSITESGQRRLGSADGQL